MYRARALRAEYWRQDSTQTMARGVGVICLMVALLAMAGCGEAKQENSPAPPGPPGVASHAPAAAEENGGASPQKADPPAVAAPPAAPFDLSYLAPETEVFIHARPAAILASPLVQTLSGGQLGGLNELKASIGLDVQQIESITMGLSGLEKLWQESQQQLAQLQMQIASKSVPTSLPPTQGLNETVFVVRTATPIDLKSLRVWGPGVDTPTPKVHANKTYYPLPPAPGVTLCVLEVDNKTFVLAPEETIQRVLDHAGGPPRAEADLSFIPAATDVVIAVAPRNRALFKASAAGSAVTPALGGGGGPNSSPGPPMGNMGPNSPGTAGIGPQGPNSPGPRSNAPGERRRRSKRDEDEEDNPPAAAVPPAAGAPAAGQSGGASELAAALSNHSTAFAVLVGLSNDVTLQGLVRCDTPEATAQIRALVTREITSAKGQFETARAQLPGVIQQVAASVLETVSIDESKDTVSLSLSLPQTQHGNLPLMPMALMGMMMQSGAGGGAEALVDWQARTQEVLERGQAAVPQEGQPEDLQWRALARWGVPRNGVAPLEVALVATGPLAQRAIAFGHLSLKEAKLADEGRLKWLGAVRAPDQEDTVDGFASIDHDQFFSPHPDEGFATGLIFGPLGPLPAALAAVEGELTLRTAGGSRTVVVAPLSVRNTTITDEALTAANFTVDVRTTGATQQIIVRHQDSPAISTIELADAHGHTMPVGPPTRSTLEEEVHETFTLPTPVEPSQLGLRVTVLEDVQEVPLSFRFEQLALPATLDSSEAQTRPESWTAAEPNSDIPEGLIVDAHARWPSADHRPPGADTPVMGAVPVAGMRLPPGQPGAMPPPGFADRGIPDTDGPSGFAGPNAGASPRNSGAIGTSGPNAGRRRSRKGEDEDDTSSPAFNAPATVAQPVAPRLTVNPDQALQVAIDLTGPISKSIVSLGMVRVESAVSDNGETLAPGGIQYNGVPLGDNWTEVRPDDDSHDQPPDGRRLLFLFTPPNPPIDRIGEFKGSLQLRSAREQVEAIVTNLNERSDRRIRDRNLSKYGLEIAVLIDANQMKFRLLEGNEDRIAALHPVDREGQQIPGVAHSRTTDGGNSIHVFDFPSNIPERVGLKFVINVGVQEITLPLQFRDITVPPAPTTFTGAASAAATPPFNGQGPNATPTLLPGFRTEDR